MVAGGAGFLGSHLCVRLLEAGNRVVCVDNLQSGSVENVRMLRRFSRFTFLEHDIVEPLPVIGRLDAIYNLACPASPPAYQENPVHTLQTSVNGSLNLLELATKNGSRILQASTSEVYGDPAQHPQCETYNGNVNPIGPRACYDEGKRCAETLFFDFHRTKGTKVKVARIFNTYGPGMRRDDGRVVSNLVVQALRGEDITIYGNGEQTRSFCYVDDMIDGLIKLMNSPRAVTGPINLGNPGEFTIRELADLVLQMTGSKSKITYLPLPVDDPQLRRPDISMANQALAWQPTTELKTGLKNTIAYFSDTLTERKAASVAAV
ncbi:MAG: UDP-glucuronic acid decarboxylase family protein [Rhizobiaceae bacterium]